MPPTMHGTQELFCPHCSARRATRPIAYDEDCVIHGVEFSFHVDAFECLTCGEELADPAHPDLTRPMYDAYRAASGTLDPAGVRAIRERSGLSQVAFATVLGMSPATSNRYALGAPIAIKEDNLLRMAGIPSALRMLMRQRGHLLKPGQRPK